MAPVVGRNPTTTPCRYSIDSGVTLGQFDQATRYAAKLDPPGFLRWLLSDLAPALAFRGWLDTRTLPFPGEPDRTCDTVAELAQGTTSDPWWALVIEFQAEPDPDMLDRLLEYLARVRRELRHGVERRGKYAVVGALLNLTGPVQSDTLEMTLPGRLGVGLRLQVARRTMRAEDATGTLQGIAAGTVARCLLPWIPLMRSGAESSMIEEWKRLADAEPQSRWRVDYGALALVFADLANCRQVWRQALEGWNMRESQQVLEWQAETRRADLLRLLQLRFKMPVPGDLAAAVEVLNDMEELSRWFDAAATAASLDDFRTTVQH